MAKAANPDDLGDFEEAFAEIVEARVLDAVKKLHLPLMNGQPWAEAKVAGVRWRLVRFDPPAGTVFVLRAAPGGVEFIDVAPPKGPDEIVAFVTRVLRPRVEAYERAELERAKTFVDAMAAAGAEDKIRPLAIARVALSLIFLFVLVVAFTMAIAGMR